MSAVVLEVRNDFAAVLADDGRIIQVKNQNYAVGQVIDLKQRQVFKNKRFSAVVAAAAVLIFCCGTGAWAYLTPYSYVSLDVNPSIEYSLNRFDTVLNVTAVNDDGQEIMDAIATENLVGTNITDAITETVNQLSEDGYFEGETVGGIVIATSAENSEKAEDLAAQIEETLNDVNEENGDTVELEVLSVGFNRVQEAKALGVTPGKLNLVEKLKASAADPESINVEEWLAKPVKEIQKATKENKKAANGITATEQTRLQEQEQLQLQEQEQVKIQEKQQSLQQKQETIKTEKQANKEEKVKDKSKDADITVVDIVTEQTQQTETADVVTNQKKSSSNSNSNTNTNSNSNNSTEKSNNGNSVKANSVPDNVDNQQTKGQGKQAENSAANKK